VRSDAPEINVPRCEELLARGKELGYLPDEAQAKKLALQMLATIS
jgi:hypothetical protein